MVRVVAVLVVVGVMVYAFVDCVRADARDLRRLPRPAWLIVILVPLAGAIAYLVAGRPVPRPVGPVARPLAPDDDPEFLRRLDLERRRRQADEERRRKQRERRTGQDNGRTEPGDGGPEGEESGRPPGLPDPS